jgi:hypothetical protein
MNYSQVQAAAKVLLVKPFAKKQTRQKEKI